MNDQERASEEVDIEPFEGKPDWQKPQAGENDQQDDGSDEVDYDEGQPLGGDPLPSVEPGQPAGSEPPVHVEPGQEAPDA